MTNRRRVLIADDHILVAELCKRLLETEFEVIGVVGDGRALVHAAHGLRPDVVVIDIAMPILNGLDAGVQVKKILSIVKLVYLTMNPDPELAAAALSRGASAYLLKTCAAADLVRAVREGKLMKEVGDVLSMSSRTVAYHKYKMMKVLGAKNTAELVRYAVKKRIVVA